jgi:heme-degrading monooxygenase HmoA
MPFVSITRLRIRSALFMPLFAFHTLRSISQVKKAPGFLCGSLLPDLRRTFWTMTVWDSQQSMRNYMTQGSHRTAMPHLLHWCDEASVTHWEQPESNPPSWADADQRMRTEGRISKVHFPSPEHADLKYAPPSVNSASPVFYGRNTVN